MNTKPHENIDVEVYREILKKTYCPVDEKTTSKKALLDVIKIINSIEIPIKGLDVNIENEVEKINVKEYGFKELNDIKIEFTTDIFKERTILKLIPKTIYELEDIIELPKANNNKERQYLFLMSDTFERLKIKAENTLDITINEKHIELYAKKNIQIIKRIFYDTRSVLKRVQETGTRTDVFILLAQNAFIMNAILYLQKMFSSFYHGEKITKEDLRKQFYDCLNMDIFLRQFKEYGNSKNKEEERIKETIKNIDNSDITIGWEGNINKLITLFYDLCNIEMPNSKTLIYKDKDKIEEFIHRYFRDKNGNPIKKSTIRICMQEYREDKRAKGKNRISVAKYHDTK